MKVWWQARKNRSRTPDERSCRPVGTSEWAHKPEGGIWTSPTNAGFGWVDWLDAEGYDPLGPAPWGGRWWELDAPDPKLYVVDSYADLVRTVADFGVAKPVLADLYAEFEWERLAELYDGFWLTSRGQAETHLSMPSMYGWDCETVFWFRWCFGEVRELDAAEVSSHLTQTAG